MSSSKLTTKAVAALVDRGFAWCVVAAYDHADLKRGDIVSCHKTYASARAASRRSGYDSQREIKTIHEAREEQQ